MRTFTYVYIRDRYKGILFIGLRRLPGGLLSVNTLPQLKCCFDFSPKTFYQFLILSKWSHRMFLLLSVENLKHGWSCPGNCRLNYYPILPFKATTTNTYYFPPPSSSISLLRLKLLPLGSLSWTYGLDYILLLESFVVLHISTLLHFS